MSAKLPGARLHREDDRQKLPPRQAHLVYGDPHSRGLNHLLDLFGVVHGAIPEDNEQALWSLREILHLYDKYHTRALDCEDREKNADTIRDRLRDALMHYAEVGNWEETTIPPAVNTAGYLSFEYAGGWNQPWKIARDALDGDALPAKDRDLPIGHEFHSDCGPHDFSPLGRWFNRGKCRHCFYLEREHPLRYWVPARPYGDKR